jgi:hypothetical protein
VEQTILKDKTMHGYRMAADEVTWMLKGTNNQLDIYRNKLD